MVRRPLLARESVMKRIFLCLAALAAFTVAAQAAENGGSPAEQRYSPYSAVVPPCDDPGVLSYVSGRFAQTESEFWSSSLQIGGYDRIHEIGFRSNGLSYIPRRYCIARTQVSDGRMREVIYDIGEDLGLLGYGWGVEWCVVGLDHELAYAPGCGALRPFASRYLGEAALRERY
ncbi:MAG: hypothetical protein E7774_05220 [Bradyrhizobium sp.]|nr:MAG: hypothetical protein E7774_05220 [Bradyrhizobium sp.]